MSAKVEEVRAMLGLFVASPWRDLYVRSGELELFLAKPDGTANPMTSDVREPAVRESLPLATLHAPHLGLFVAGLTAGAPVTPGMVIAQIEVLGEREEIVAEHAGHIAAVLVENGALVEYGTPLFRLAA